jgi:hypothetical protein
MTGMEPRRFHVIQCHWFSSFYEGLYRYSSTQSLVEPLAADELSENRPFLVALDAEFVALSREETEVHSDGTRSLVRPVRMHLARVRYVTFLCVIVEPDLLFSWSSSVIQ